MLFKLSILFLLFSIANTQQFLYSVDLSVATTQAQVDCIAGLKYQNMFIRVFQPDGKTGKLDQNGVATVKRVQNNALKMGYDVYMTPDTMATNTGAQQFDLLYRGLTQNGITPKRVFVQVVVAGAYWSLNTPLNVKFLNSLFLSAKQLGVQVGIFTTAEDWKTITANAATLIPSDALLWYYSYYKDGSLGESAPSFADFAAFGPFTKGSVVAKQFAHAEAMCGITVNRDVFVKA